MTNYLGYAHPKYALSLQDFGEPYQLTNCGGWILVRPIPGTPYKDAMGCYPRFACQDWSKLHEDMESVGSEIISLVIVTDPFSGVAPTYLEKCFSIVKPFKTHYIGDLNQPLKSIVGKVHRKNARRALEIMDVEICHQPGQYLDEWINLYANLIKRHDIKGINAFSPKGFAIQLNIPGMVMFLGKVNGEVVGGTLLLIREQVAYFHLSAYTSEGYKIRASYATHWKALEYLCEQGIRYFDIGGMAGLEEDPSDGLAEFKRGWSNDRRTAYFCGQVFDRDKYEAICRQYQITDVDYFPSYRVGEFGSTRHVSDHGG